MDCVLSTFRIHIVIRSSAACSWSLVREFNAGEDEFVAIAGVGGWVLNAGVDALVSDFSAQSSPAATSMSIEKLRAFLCACPIDVLHNCTVLSMEVLIPLRMLLKPDEDVRLGSPREVYADGPAWPNS